ncbi:Uncharacterized protein TCM_028376 [Theobroma cacao]|uniref:Uncharacterized protein n=1 Tax=Theobroma cacao TaxID=3641 RepID=A0A061G9L4_THECC|nr:Uncharacterized protein TCM_028376 [Theobroma cacao]
MMPSVVRLIQMMIVMPVVENTLGDVGHWDIASNEDCDAVLGEIALDDDFDILLVTLELGSIELLTRVKVSIHTPMCRYILGKMNDKGPRKHNLSIHLRMYR